MKRSFNISTLANLTLVSLLLFGLSCQKDVVEPAPHVEDTVLHYFPLEPDNQWIYLHEGFRPGEPVQYTQTEKWVTSLDRWLLFYEVTDDGDEYTGYKPYYYLNDQEISDIVGTYVSVDYLDLSPDSLILIARDSFDFLRERYIQGGTTRMSTTFGERDCIGTITHFHPELGLRKRYSYFCKGIGIWIMEEQFIDSLPDGTEKVGFIKRKTLLEYALQ
jgi:hypothetical protein